MRRSQAIQELTTLIAGINLKHPVRVGIDGVDCAGKTTLADELVKPLQSSGRAVIRASIDGFHNPVEIRRRQGPASPKGYYEDSFDLQAVQRCLLLPLGPKGDRIYKVAQFDFRTDTVVQAPWVMAPEDAILIFDGIFLHRPELRPYWDFTVFVEVSFENTRRRALARDKILFGSVTETKGRYEERYIPGQKIYLDACNPADAANVIFDNNEFDSPKLLVHQPPGKTGKRQ